MQIQTLYIHPIKSLRGIPVPSFTLTRTGPLHDRTFLLRLDDHTLEPLLISKYPQLSLFAQSFDDNGSDLVVRHPSDSAALRLPLSPDIATLTPAAPVELTNSSCPSHDAGDGPTHFFSTALGFAVRLVYIGTASRAVIGNVAPPSSGLSISFTDCAPLLLTTMASLSSVGSDADMTKFRPNIVVSGEDVAAWEEDYWGTVVVAGKHTVVLSANCARCTSLNVDYDTGGWVAPERQLLKRMMKERRVDPGTRYSPVFGRYGYLECEGVAEPSVSVSVGDEVVVGVRNAERTEFCNAVFSTARLIFC
jgi:uncharacterized protein YcbX